MILAGLATPSPARAQWVQEHEQFYLPAEHNWVFRRNYVGVDRLFNAFDYGHAILYETLYTEPDAPVARLEGRQFDFLTQRLLKQPPRVPLEESAVEIEYAKLVPETKLMFEWAHVLHRQLYDVLADERLSRGEQDAAVAEVLAYYRSRSDLAFSSVPKSMDLMDGQSYSLAFRERYPKFNGLIWAYHWLQVGLYEPLLVNSNSTGRTAGVTATLGRFWAMLENAPETTPYLMPMTAAIAPTFAALYPEAAIIFDNLHMMHDVISDILASSEVPRNQKRSKILEAAAAFRDPSAFSIPIEQWAGMGETMGLNNMGGPAVGFTAALPTPTVPRGMSMAGMDHSQMAVSNNPGVGVDQAGISPEPNSSLSADSVSVSMATLGLVRDLIARLLVDPTVAQRIESDPDLRELSGRLNQAIASQAAPPAGQLNSSPADPTLRLLSRLLADPAVMARVHALPELHQLWSAPEVQRRLETVVP